MPVIKANTFFSQKKFSGPTIILDGLSTPDNIGSIMRLAGNIGCKRLVFTERIELNQTKINKIARNSLKYFDIEFMTYKEIQDSFENLIAIETSSESKNIFNTILPQSSAFIVGNEKRGISENLLAHCVKHIYIPMPGNVKSLNVSHALSVGLFEWYRQNYSSQ